jgi:hypothetical protein
MARSKSTVQPHQQQPNQSFYLYQGNGGPWRCGICAFDNFDLRKICLKCQKRTRPPFHPNKSWPCTEYQCCYYINSHEMGSCERCGSKKYEPPVVEDDNSGDEQDQQKKEEESAR